VRHVLGTEVMVGYGLTEAFGFVLAGPGSGRPGACGRPVPGFDLRLVDEAGQPVGPDEIGTLELRGPTVAQSYWGDATPTVDREGWFRTPDRFLIDRDGNYHHCGRVDQLFKVGGKWVSPAEVERALLAHEAVWECAVIGAEDEDGLLKPFAYVVANIGHTPGRSLEAELREYVRRELSPYKYPRWIEFVAELPKGPHGKVLRYKLRDRLKSSRRRRTESPPP
jgi:benzoate-CoA ligase